MDLRAYNNANSPVNQAIEKAFAVLSKYSGVGRKEGIQFIAELEQQKAGLTDTDKLAKFLKKIGAVQFKDKYGKQVRVEDIVAFDLKKQQAVFPAALHCDRKQAPPYLGKFPTAKSAMFRKTHLYTVLKDCYQLLLPIYQSTQTEPYNETQLATSQSFQEAAEFCRQADDNFIGKLDLARNVTVCGMMHFGQPTAEHGSQLTDDDALQKIKQQLKQTAGEGTVDATTISALAHFLIHHGGADLVTAPPTREMNNTVSNIAGAKLSAGKARLSVDTNPGYRWENGKLVGKFELQFYDFQDHTTSPPTHYGFDPNTQSYLAYTDPEILERSFSAQAEPSASMKFRVALNVDEAGNVTPHVSACQAYIRHTQLQQRPLAAKHFQYNNELLTHYPALADEMADLQAEKCDYKAMKDLRRDYTVNQQAHFGYTTADIKSVADETLHKQLTETLGNQALADFVAHHGHQHGLMKSLENIVSAHVNQNGDHPLSMLNTSPEVVDFSLDDNGALIATFNIKIFNFVEDSQPVKYYGYQNNAFVVADDEHQALTEILTMPNDDAKLWTYPCARANAKVVITPNEGGDGVSIDWQSVECQVNHPSLLARTQPMIDEVKLAHSQNDVRDLPKGPRSA